MIPRPPERPARPRADRRPAVAGGGVPCRRGGAVLLEVLLSIALLVVCAASILGALSQAALAEQRVRWTLEAMDFARSTMAAIEAGLESAEAAAGAGPAWPESVGLAEGDRADAISAVWEREVEIDPSGFRGLSLVTVTLRRRAGDGAGASATLRQLVRLSDEGEDRAGPESRLVGSAARPAGRPRRRVPASPRSARRGATGRRRSGFTILELLIAIGLIAGLMAGLFAFVWNVMLSRDELTDRAVRTRTGLALVDRLGSALATAIAGDGRLGPGVSGDAASIRVLSRGVPAVDSVRHGSAMGDLAGVELAFDRDSGRVSVRAWSGPAADAAVAAVMEHTIGDLRLRYHDGRGWVDRFNSLEAGSLPTAIEVAIWFDPVEGAEHDEPSDEFDDAGLEVDAGPSAEPARPRTRPDAPPPPGRSWAEDAGRPDGSVAGPAGGSGAADRRPPDRVRLFAVPDGPGRELSARGGGA